MTGADLTTIAQNRRSEPPKLIHAVRGDLDWIAMKALEKDRARRYATANGLALDVERYLANEPIAARPPSRLYKLQKIILRHKFLFISIGIFSLLLIVGLFVVSASLAKERQARRDAEAESVKSRQVIRFLESTLSGVGPSVALGEDTKVLRGILDRTANGFGSELTNQPAVEAELRSLLGKLYEEIGNGVQAEQMHRAALATYEKLFGPESKEVAATFDNLGLAFVAQNKLSKAENVDGKALAIRRRLFGEENAETATSLNHLSAVLREEGRLTEAEPMAREALAIQKRLLGNTNLVVADSLRNLSIILGDQGKWAESEAMAREVLAMRRQLLGPEHPWVASSLNDVAWAAGARGKLDEAEALEREALAMRQKLLGVEHPDAAKSLYLVGDRMRQRGNLGEAYSVLSAALTMQRKLLGEDNPDIRYTLSSMGLALEGEGRFSEAEAVQREELALWRKCAGSEDPKTVGAMEKLATTLEAQAKWSDAETLRREALAESRKRLGNENTETLIKLRRLGFALEGEGKWAEAEGLWRESLIGWQKQKGFEDQETKYTLDKLVSVLQSEGKWAEAETSRREEWLYRRQRFGDDARETLFAWRDLGLTFEAENKWAEAETIWSDSLPAWRKREGNEGQQSMYTLRKLGLVLEAEGKWAEAEAKYREALAMSRKETGDDGPEALTDLERLVGVLVSQKKFGEAVQLLDEVQTPAFVSQPSSVDFLVKILDLMARHGRWREASVEATFLLHVQPDEHYNYHRLACLLVMIHDRSDYEQLCQRLLTKFGNPTDPYVAEREAQDCLLVPHSGVDLALVDKIADTAIALGSHEPNLPYFQACKAMSSYRLGRFAEAINSGEKAAGSSIPEAQAKAFAVLAMAHWQMGQSETARTMLTKGDALTPDVFATRDDADIGESWVAWLFARISLDEAASLIRSRSSMGNNPNQRQE
jgi:tetratricopeptide (TPR) repeat protein